MLSTGIVAAAGRPYAQSQEGDPYPSAASANSRAILRRPASLGSREAVAPPAEPKRASQHKTWKDLARAHNEEKEKSRETPGATTLSPWTAVCALAVVVCLILILARIFRRHAPRFGQSLPTEALEVLGRRFLDQRQSIILLRIGSRIVVVGSSAAGLQGIGELSDPVEVDLIAGLCRGSGNGRGLGTSFLSLLKGQAAPQAQARPRKESARRAEPRMADPAVDVEPPAARMSDPEHELLRRLRGGSIAAAPNSEVAEVFRD